MNQFDVSITPDGNFLVSSGYVIPLRSGQDPIEVAAQATDMLSPIPVSKTGLRGPFAGLSIFSGGSGRNLRVQAPGLTEVPEGYFKAYDSVNFAGLNFPAASVAMNADDSVVISDGTGTIADLPTGALTTTVPTAGFSVPATTYGKDTYNGGNPFDLQVWGESDPASFAFPPVQIFISKGTALADTYNAIDGDHYTAATDADWTLTLNADGTADLADAVDIVATRPVGMAHDPYGRCLPTTHGMDTYNAGEPFDVLVTPVFTQPIEGWIWIEITETTAGIVDAVSRPFFGMSVPSPTSTVYPVKLAYSDGAGHITQFQQGPVFWS